MAILAALLALATLLIAVRDGEAGSSPLVLTVDTTSSDNTGSLTTCNPNTANDCSLRGAILRVNANPVTPDLPNIINFRIGAGDQTITLTAVLPAITGPVLINGDTQPIFANVSCFQVIGGDGVPCIHINGDPLSSASHSGFVLQGDGSTIHFCRPTKTLCKATISARQMA